VGRGGWSETGAEPTIRTILFNSYILTERLSLIEGRSRCRLHIRFW
jgi:hypothetical protein